MKLKNNCICQLFKKIKHGQLVQIQFISGLKVTYTFLKIQGDCVYVESQGKCITLECDSIISVSCLPKPTPCTISIHLENPGPISCTATITGRITCGVQPIPGVIVELSSQPNILNFANPNLVTDMNGEFSTPVTIEPGTPIQVVELTATANINNITYTQNNFVMAGCHECTQPALDVTFPSSIECEGTIEGNVSCNGTPIENAMVFFTVNSTNDMVFVHPNPVLTDANGNFTTTLMSMPGVDETITITASTTVAGITVTVGPESVNVDCPQVECPCKFNLRTKGRFQPGAVVEVTRFGHTETLTGRMNINVNQCGSSSVGPCNPAVNNFNFTFNANNGDTFQFTMGRRISISCDGNTASLNGVAMGSVNNGPNQTFMVDITATLDSVNNIITWEIVATSDSITQFETTQEFVAASTPQSFIENCP